MREHKKFSICPRGNSGADTEARGCRRTIDGTDRQGFGSSAMRVLSNTIYAARSRAVFELLEPVSREFTPEESQKGPRAGAFAIELTTSAPPIERIPRPLACFSRQSQY